MSASHNPLDYEAIRNTLALYCIALDTKDFNLLDQVFTDDVETVYPFGGTRKGVADIKAAIEKRLSPVTTQHALTTTYITLPVGQSNTATVKTYFTGTHFGRGKWEGQQVTAWGWYDDTLRMERNWKGTNVLPGASGSWKVCRREVGFFKRMGEEGVMEGE